MLGWITRSRDKTHWDRSGARALGKDFRVCVSSNVRSLSNMSPEPKSLFTSNSSSLVAVGVVWHTCTGGTHRWSMFSPTYIFTATHGPTISHCYCSAYFHIDIGNIPCLVCDISKNFSYHPIKNTEKRFATEPFVISLMNVVHTNITW